MHVVAEPTYLESMMTAIEDRRMELRLTVGEMVARSGITAQGWIPVRRGQIRNYQDKVKLAVAQALDWPDDAIDRLLKGETKLETVRRSRTDVAPSWTTEHNDDSVATLTADELLEQIRRALAEQLVEYDSRQKSFTVYFGDRDEDGNPQVDTANPRDLAEYYVEQIRDVAGIENVEDVVFEMLICARQLVREHNSTQLKMNLGLDNFAMAAEEGMTDATRDLAVDELRALAASEGQKPDPDEDPED